MTVKRESVLICDDDPEVAENLQDALKPNYDAYIASTVPLAISMLTSDRKYDRAEDRYTAVIIDLAFKPKERGLNDDGFQILEEAIKDPHIEPILFTGYGSQERVIRAMDWCAFKYVAKNSRKLDPRKQTLTEDDMIPDITQVVLAVENASKRRSALLKLEKIPVGTAMSSQEVLELRQCLIQLRRPTVKAASLLSGM
jgi:DNA-binding NtrC family response regulator